MNHSPEYFVRRAVTWRMLTEIVRHYVGQVSLEIVEERGHYDSLHLVASGHGNLATFNSPFSHVHWLKPLGPTQLRLENVEWPRDPSPMFVEAWLKDPSKTTKEVEQLCGLPPRLDGKLAPTTPRVLVYRLIATLLERHALSPDALNIRSGWAAYHDGSNVEPLPPTLWNRRRGRWH